MMQALRAEFSKLFTVRSTYIISALVMLLISFLSFWAMGYAYKDQLDNLAWQKGILQNVAPITSIFAVIVAILLMAHEYRYNTVIYTLTFTNSRSRVLVAKMITIFIYVFGILLINIGLFMLLSRFGLSLGGNPLPPQQLSLDIFVKALFYAEGFALAGLLFATLIRNLIFAIVFMFIAPNTIEGLITLVLKQKAIYLPFSSLSQVIAVPGQVVDSGPFQIGRLSPAKGAAVFILYLIIGWIITWYLFLKRDAN
jgi:ABC-type transport system involved in multi-copper enzyme maturation permease subunit